SHAQNAGPTEQETIQTLIQEVKQLQEKVKALEAKQASPAEESQSSEPPDSNEKVANTASLPEEELHLLHGIQWRGFGEVNYKALDQRKPELTTGSFVGGSAASSYIGDFDLLINSHITDKASVLAEMVVSEGDAQSFTVGLDRMLLKYDYNDHFR